MASDDDEPIVDFYAHQFNIEEAARLSGAKPDRIRSWLLHEVVPDIGLKHPKLKAWLFSGLDIIRLRAMVDAADIQDNIATAAKVSEIVRDRFARLRETTPNGHRQTLRAMIVRDGGEDRILLLDWNGDGFVPRLPGRDSDIAALRRPHVDIPVDEIIFDGMQAIFREVKNA